jgi:hypothetical protein
MNVRGKFDMEKVKIPTIHLKKKKRWQMEQERNVCAFTVRDVKKKVGEMRLCTPQLQIPYIRYLQLPSYAQNCIIYASFSRLFLNLELLKQAKYS